MAPLSRHDFGDAEAVADFDEFAAGDDDFAAVGERGQDEQDGGGAIVDDDGGFGAGQAFEEMRGVDVALAACAGFEIVFEIGVLRGGAAKFFDGGFGERRAAKIGVQDDAGGVDDRLKRAGEDLLDRGRDVFLESRGVEPSGLCDLHVAGDFGAQVGQRGAGDFEKEIAIDVLGEGGEARLGQEFVDGRNLAQEIGLVGGEGAPRRRCHGVIST